MYVLMNHELDSYHVKNKYIKVDDTFLTVISWTYNIAEAYLFDSETSADLFIAHNKEYLDRNLDCDNIFVGKLVPQIISYCGNFGKNRVG